MEHEFTAQIMETLAAQFGKKSEAVFEKSSLLQYLNIKTRSATRGSKARASFANLYAIYVLVEDYLKHDFDRSKRYSDYEGGKFSDLFQRQRELPFGSKLQNHALNSRMNEEFKKYFPQVEYVPILRNLQTNRYWVNENLLKVVIGKRHYNIARAVIGNTAKLTLRKSPRGELGLKGAEKQRLCASQSGFCATAVIGIVDRYIEAKRNAFVRFIETCERLKGVVTKDDREVEGFISSLLAPNVDARIFEIASYAILKFFYHDQAVYFGFDLSSIQKERLKLYKTGRTNANDGGIDFVMRPLGRFFQVTETLDVRKYMLDIDKLEHYPVSFVIKSEDSIDTLRQKLREGAERRYAVKAIVERFMDSVEEIINLAFLQERFRQTTAQGYLRNILDEVIVQSKIEFNYEEDGTLSES